MRRSVRFNVRDTLGIAVSATLAVALTGWTVSPFGDPPSRSVVVGGCAIALCIQSLALSRRERQAAHEVDRLQAIARARADRISVLSHEIRTPLAVIKGGAELLLEGSTGPVNERQHTFLQRLVTNANALTRLAESLLSQARIEASLFDMKPRLVDCRAMLLSTVDELRQLYGPSIILDAPGAPTRAMLDPGLISQAVMNAVTNAIHHSPEESEVTIRLTHGEGRLCISIEDNGSGIALAEQPLLFDSYYSSMVERGGTGLGLFIARAIIELHGGQVYVSTQEGHGTTLSFFLPVQHGENDA